VTALTADPFVFYESAPDSGFSVDNLSPPIPAPFAGVYGLTSTALHWGISPAPDLREFRLYRGLAPEFVPSPANLILATRDTGYVDPARTAYVYKLAAVDNHGNVSDFAVVGGGGAVAERQVFSLEGIRPNPAVGGALTVFFSLPSAEPARLELLDVSGRSIVARDVGSLGPGPHTLDLAAGRRVPPGIYLVRLSQRGTTRIVRAAVLN
jgi:hypothetical protein